MQRSVRFVQDNIAGYFEDLTPTELKNLIDSGVELSDINNYVSSIRREIRYHTQQSWIDWIITSPTKQRGLSAIKYIASKARVSISSLSSKVFLHQLASYLVGDTRISEIYRLKKQLRVNRAKELLRRGEDPRDIMENTFQVQFQSDAQLKLFYESLFYREPSIRGKASFDDIIYSYSSLPGYYLGKYK